MNIMNLANGKKLLSGTSGDDVLCGNDIDDTIQGNGGNDQIWGGFHGNDTLVGGNGATSYWWGHDDGNDTIRSQSGSDALMFYEDGSAGGHLVYSGNDLVLYYNTANKLTLKDWRSKTGRQRLQNFVWNQSGIMVDYLWNEGQAATGNLALGNLAFKGVHRLVSIDSGENTLIGSAGDDQLLGSAGSNQLWGGTGGNDVLAGGSGSNGFWWGADDGNDTVITSDSDDAMVFYGNGSIGCRLSYNNTDGDLHFAYNNDSQVTLENWKNTAASQRLQNFVWNENGTLIDYVWNDGSAATAHLYDSALTRNNIHRAIGWGSANMTICGSSGNDYLQGGSGNDQLWGGTGGTDTLAGGTGADTYWCGTHGNVIINDDAGNSADTIYFYDERKSDLTFSRSVNDILMSGHGKTTRLVNGMVDKIGTVRFSDGTTMTGRQLVSAIVNPTSTTTKAKKAFVFSIGQYTAAQNLDPRWGSLQVDPAFAQKLRNNGWQVSGIYNTDATTQNTYNALRNFANTVQANDNVMLLLSSHGGLNKWNHQEQSDCFSLSAYEDIIGINLKGRTYKSSPNSPAELDLASSLETISNRAGSGGHVTILLDSCHSGAVAIYANEKGFNNMTILASCQPDQESRMEGYTDMHVATGEGFVSYTEQALSGAADYNHDGYVSVAELGSYDTTKMNTFSSAYGSTVTWNDNHHGDYKYNYLV